MVGIDWTFILIVLKEKSKWFSAFIDDTNYNDALIFKYEENSLFNHYKSFEELKKA